jgi:hypothetical protein
MKLNYSYRRRLATLRAEYRMAVSYLRTPSPSASVFFALVVLVALWYILCIASSRPADAPTDQAGALLLSY